MKKLFYFNFLLLLAALSTSHGLAAQDLVTVTDCNLNGWVKDQRGNSVIGFSEIAPLPPMGKGSLRFATPDLSFGRLRNSVYSGTALSALTELKYSTFIEQRDSTVDVNFLVLLIDVNADNTAEYNLVFDPRYQTQPFVKNFLPDQGITRNTTWQTWDALRGGWFVGPDPNDDPDHNGAFFSLATFIGQHPGARIMNDAAKGGAAIRLTVGGPVFSRNYTGYADNFRIGVAGQTKVFDFEFSTANAGQDKTVILGYGSNCTVLTGMAAGGVAPYTYAWSGGIISSAAAIEVCPAATTSYTLTIKDANLCTRTDQVLVLVNDVRCGSKLDKVNICHQQEQLCVAASAVAAHLKHGDQLGECEQSNIRLRSGPGTAIRPSGLTLANFPNPFTTKTRINYELPFSGRVVVKVYDLFGRELALLVNEDKKAGRYVVDFIPGKLSGGMYFFKTLLSSGKQSISDTKSMVVLQ